METRVRGLTNKPAGWRDSFIINNDTLRRLGEPVRNDDASVFDGMYTYCRSRYVFWDTYGRRWLFFFFLDVIDFKTG